MLNKKLFSIAMLYFASFTGVYALTVNPSQTISHRVTVQPIIVSDNDGSNTASFMGSASAQSEIEGYIDQIWGQAGIDVKFLNPNNWNNTFANWGAGGPPNNAGNTRPQSDLTTIVNDGASAGVTNSDSSIINIFFVKIAAGFGLLSDNNAAGLGYVSGNGITQYVGSNLLGFTGGREVVASVIAHEIGHNLGLVHTTPDDNLMTPGGNGEILDSTQIATALGSDLVTAVPLPAAFWFMFSGFALLFRFKQPNAIA